MKNILCPICDTAYDTITSNCTACNFENEISISPLWVCENDAKMWLNDRVKLNRRYWQAMSYMILQSDDVCEKCNCRLVLDAMFCYQCGHAALAVEDTLTTPSVFCATCGTAVRKDKKFCKGCGATLGKEAPVAEFVDDSPAEPPPLLCSCGAIVRKDKKFCKECGTAVVL